MIQRRQFLGSMAAACVASGSANQLFAGTDRDKPRPLNWRCDIISTTPHGSAQRSPVVTGVSLQPSSAESPGNLIAIVGDDHYVSIYDLVQKQFIKHIGKHTDWVRATEFSPNGTMLASAGNDRQLRIWNTTDWNATETVLRHPEAIIDIAFSNDSTKLATVGFEHSLRIYDTRTRQLMMRRNCPCADNRTVAFSKDDKLIAAAGRSGEITVWDADSGDKLHSIKSHRKRIRSLEFTDDGHIISCSDDQIVRVTNPLDSSSSRSLPRHAAKLYDVTLLSQELLATSGSDNLIRIWQFRDAFELGTLKGHTGTVSCLDSSGNTMASGGYDTQVRIWDLAGNLGTGRQTRLPDRWQRHLK